MKFTDSLPKPSPVSIPSPSAYLDVIDPRIISTIVAKTSRGPERKMGGLAPPRPRGASTTTRNHRVEPHH